MATGSLTSLKIKKGGKVMECEVGCLKIEQLHLSEAEKRTFEKIEAECLKMRRTKIEYLRNLFWKKGIAALNLKDLKSEKGFRFKETESIGFRKAESVEFSKKDFWESRETAYFCPNGCGWVKGLPYSGYDNLGSASLNVRYFCEICGSAAGRREIVLR